MMAHLSAAARALASREWAGNSRHRKMLCHNDAPVPVVSYSIPAAQAGCTPTCTTISWGGTFHDHIDSPYRADRRRRCRRRGADRGRSVTAQAAAPLTGQQAPGWYRYKVGSIEVTVATDGVNRFRLPDTFVTNQSRDEVNAGAGGGLSAASTT